ncbi:bestrophin family protein [Skeletonema marinoi]|uniref:Bestrophin family protein n=1 Tax=Skeletonema marinoi TaxID=267567 RepID=A0AAD9DCM3_9STRA|nr:bestrophin family protein [Skeletonema marinoi]
MTYSMRFTKSHRKLADVDDEEGKAQFFLLLLFQSIEDSAGFFVSTILFLVVWSILCSFGAMELRSSAAANPGGVAELWLDDIEECKTAVSIIGTLFVFTLIFRFNACYDRWWEARIFWGDIISKSLDLGIMNRRWFDDAELQNQMSRFIVVYSYACKALLRGQSLTHEEGDGSALVERGLLSQQELDLMDSSPSWQPFFCLEVIRAIVVQFYGIPDMKGFKPGTGKLQAQIFRNFDNNIKDLVTLIGNCVRIRASGLPASYDAITMTSFIAFFLLASVVWSTAIGWMTPIVVFCASVIIMFLILMGTKLVDPFGLDKVDIPMECFCATLEAQMQAIDERNDVISEVTSATARSGLKNRRVLVKRQATFHIPNEQKKSFKLA